jgi:predicted MPP superfamily phosphohydrolase
MNDAIKSNLEQRLGRLQAQQRLAIERDHKAQISGETIIGTVLKLTGLYWRGQADAVSVQVRENNIRFGKLPPAFDGFTLLHISDLHAETNEGAMRRLEQILPDLSYDICVLTGDYRGTKFGEIDAALTRLRVVLALVARPIYGVLGNYDTIRMVPDLEAMGVQMLLNECAPIERGGATIYLAGIDDAHHYRADDIEKAASSIPHETFSILLSHTPEIYRQAAVAGFDLLLSGHTHGGQICLPGSIPITLHAVLPRRFGAGAWKYHDMAGYTSTGVGTSIVAVRINCLPEITLHRLWLAKKGGSPERQ